MGDEKLKPCPHCECDTPWLESAEHTQGLRWYVFCHACGAMGGWKPTATEAIAAWNARAAKPCYATDHTHDGCKYSVNRGWVENVAHGTLTAEQVRDVLLLHLPHREYYSIAQTDGWQAIADELNAELGSGTCETEARL